MRFLLISTYLSILLLMFCIHPFTAAFAQDAMFDNKLESSFRLHDDGHASVVHKVTLQSNNSKYYPDSFSFQIDPKTLDQFVVNSRFGQLQSQPTEDGMRIILPAQLSSDSSPSGIQFEMKYTYLPAASQKGHLWEVSLPVFVNSQDISLSLQRYNVIVPDSWGGLQVAYPVPISSEKYNGESVYTFEVQNNSQLPELHLVFGSFQLYDLNLRYPLVNESNDDTIFVVTFPPPIANYQKIFVNTIDPEPDTIEMDTDGNVLGKYLLKPNEQKLVTFIGQAQIQIPQELPQQSPQLAEPLQYTLPDLYWESNDDMIQNLAIELDTPTKIYQYITEHLTYDAKRAQTAPVERYGAIKALQHPDESLCMEFTDATIALLRAAEIPAREINGYTFINKTDVQPIATDVLHAWVQYWDTNRGWINIDPTWGSTTGRDYFNSFDNDHVIFAIKGITSTKPLPAGSYRDKNYNLQTVKVELADKTPSSLVTFESWLDQYTFNRLPWWKKWWLKVTGQWNS
ncbi:transglutaminase domain-containing protein [candidate division WWE3 bacterium]|nr:transglutaminase domain-containing protein [candidate division WWE3 bacterium]